MNRRAYDTDIVTSCSLEDVSGGGLKVRRIRNVTRHLHFLRMSAAKVSFLIDGIGNPICHNSIFVGKSQARASFLINM